MRPEGEPTGVCKMWVASCSACGWRSGSYVSRPPAMVARTSHRKICVAAAGWDNPHLPKDVAAAVARLRLPDREAAESTR